MKRKLTDWEIEVIDNWNTTYDGILKWKWSEVQNRFNLKNELDFIDDEEIKISLLSLHPNDYKEIIKSEKLIETIGNTTIYKLLKNPTGEGYAKKAAEDLVKLYISNYWGALCR